MHTRKSFYTPCRTDKMPLDPLFVLYSTNLGGENPPMSIEAVVHAEDAGCRGYDSVGTLLSKPCQSMVCSAMTRSPKAFFVTFCRLGQKVSKKPFEGVFVPSKWLRFSLQTKIFTFLSAGASPCPTVYTGILGRGNPSPTHLQIPICRSLPIVEWRWARMPIPDIECRHVACQISICRSVSFFHFQLPMYSHS